MHCHMPICYTSGYTKTINTQLISNQRGRAVCCITGRGAEWVGSNLARDIYFHFEFFNPSLFRTAQWITCKWNQAWQFTSSHGCFRPQIQLIIQDVYINSRSIALTIQIDLRPSAGHRGWSYSVYIRGHSCFAQQPRHTRSQGGSRGSDETPPPLKTNKHY